MHKKEVSSAKLLPLQRDSARRTGLWASRSSDSGYRTDNCSALKLCNLHQGSRFLSGRTVHSGRLTSSLESCRGCITAAMLCRGACFHFC